MTDYASGYMAGVRATRTNNVRQGRRVARWNPDLREFELQCPDCRDACRSSYWPITLEFWHPRTVLRCRACHAARDRARQAARRLDPAKRLQDNASTAAWRARHPGYNVETAALWRQQNPERKRAQDKAYHERTRRAA